MQYSGSFKNGMKDGHGIFKTKFIEYYGDFKDD